MKNSSTDVKPRIKVKQKDSIEKITVIGLGRIGLPLALLLADKNYEVIGVDNNKSLIDDVNNIRLNKKNT